MCVCVFFSLFFFFFFLISILYANVRNALIKKIKTKQKQKQPMFYAGKIGTSAKTTRFKPVTTSTLQDKLLMYLKQ